MPIRIEIPWERMRELLGNIGEISEDEVNSEKDLNDFMGNGRNCFSCSRFSLTTEEIIALYDAGFEDIYNGDILLVVKKETYPGIYMIGEF